MIDLHIHTARCRHGLGTVAEYVDAAREVGATTIAFTEHLPLPDALLRADPAAMGYAMPASELPAYVDEVLRAREAAGSTGGPEVLLGIEVDLHPGNEDHVRTLVDSYPFDLVLGSVHYIDGWAFDDPSRTEGYTGWDIAKLWERYFDDVVRAASTGLADVIAHADLIKKFGYVPHGDLRPFYAEAAEAFAAAGCVVEVNTAGLRKPCAELYPSDAFLRELRKAGVRVTVGSDAHAPCDVCTGYSQAVDALRRAGYESIVVLREHAAVEVPL
ncbi:MAG: histidinol-phosphatase HisJ family protein [Coriobacteriales bacterium]|nr:histidinol-phosphatase HisJ family protein [Actinomycetes bacterium]